MYKSKSLGNQLKKVEEADIKELLKVHQKILKEKHCKTTQTNELMAPLFFCWMGGEMASSAEGKEVWRSTQIEQQQELKIIISMWTA